MVLIFNEPTKVEKYRLNEFLPETDIYGDLLKILVFLNAA